MNGFAKVTMRRFGGALTVGALVASAAVGLAGGSTSASAATGTGVSCVPTGQLPQFDDEPGGFGQESDCVVAVPDRTVGGAKRAGAVEVDQTGAGHIVLTRA